ncbi:MAG: PQQ-binding-like beta-propeller repeat protein [Alphaproteobacteria bacterium]|nr:PQQ-binding-like beta-propeller repeat protein [Alphaproteobacteria bacterium]
MKKSGTPLTRRTVLNNSAAAMALAATPMGEALAQAPAAPAAGGLGGTAPANTDWTAPSATNRATRYAPLDQINASNFNSLEVAWRFKTDNFGNHPDAFFNSTPLVVKGRMYATVGLSRYLVCLDPATGQILWTYRHDEKGRTGARGGSGWGCAYWTDGKEERILYVTISYQLISIDAKTGLPDPKFGDGTEVDLRKDWDHTVDPRASIVGLHAAPTVCRDVAVVGAASASTGPGHIRGYDVRTGKRKWIFHTVPQKGEFGYDTWQAGQAETATNTGVWAPMTADEELGTVYCGVELPQADWIGKTRFGNALFTETLVALDIETGKRKWHYQTEHHGLWDRDICAAAILYDLPYNGRMVKALAQPTKQAFLFVLNRETGQPIWPIEERRVEAGNVPGEFYSPTQPFPSKPPPFDHQGFTPDDGIDWTPAIKTKVQEILSHYHMGPIYTPPILATDTIWGTITTPENQGGSNWPGGSLDPESGIFYIYSKSTPQVYAIRQGADGNASPAGATGQGTNDNMGGGFGGSANPGGRAGGLGGPVRPGTRDGINDPVFPNQLTLNGMSILKPPYGRITAIDLKTGTKLWQVAHGETPDYIKNNELLRGVTIPRTGQSGVAGVLTTKSLVICGDTGQFTDERGRKASRFRAYDKMTGREVGTVFMDQAQTGSPMTYMLNGRQYIVVASGGLNGAEYICYSLPGANAAAAGDGGRGGRGGGAGRGAAPGAPAGRGAPAAGNGGD